MRVIEKNMVRAIKDGRKKWTSGNTQVLIVNEGQKGQHWAVCLHGNLIARLYPFGMEFTLAGWNTVTTRSRINALLNAFAQDGVFQRKGLPYLSQGLGKPRLLSAHEWVRKGSVPEVA